MTYIYPIMQNSTNFLNLQNKCLSNNRGLVISYGRTRGCVYLIFPPKTGPRNRPRGLSGGTLIWRTPKTYEQ